MNIRLFIIGLTFALGGSVAALAQQPAPVVPPMPTQAASARTALTKFNLDFPGGTPGELVAAIQKAMGRSLNVIIPPEQASRALPPLKMNNVDVAQLFPALSEALLHTEWIAGSQMQSAFMIRTRGEPTDDSVWSWINGDSAKMPQATRFFLLTPYLNQGLSVDDITTTIQTAWKMRNATSNPAISFHKETKLLIAVGDPQGLETIDQALRALGGGAAKATSGAGEPTESQMKQP